MPVAAVIAGGRPFISSGSSAAICGTSFRSMIANLRVLAGSEITAAIVTSEPVPAVVGTTYIGKGRQNTRNRPAILAIGGLLLALLGPCRKKEINRASNAGLPAARAAIILAASIDEPPPTASTAVQPLSCNIFRPV